MALNISRLVKTNTPFTTLSHSFSPSSAIHFSMLVAKHSAMLKQLCQTHGLNPVTLEFLIQRALSSSPITYGMTIICSRLRAMRKFSLEN